MNTKIVSEQTLKVIDQYRNFHIGNAICSIPYFNNRIVSKRAGLRANIGKGSPRDIFEEVEQIIRLQKIDLNSLDGEHLKKILVDNNIGIDCSGFAYYILNEESMFLGKGTLDKHLHFPYSKGIFGKIKSMLRPVENTGVNTFAHSKNSKKIEIKDVKVGDIITILRNEDEQVRNIIRNHILIITQIEYQNFLPITLHYAHSIAWPTDGEYGHGIHTGKIDILDINKNILDQRWIENEKIGDENYTHSSAKSSTVELRRLNWF